jgi:hypothetical protein
VLNDDKRVLPGGMRAPPPAIFRGESLVEGWWGKAPKKFKKFTMPRVHSD